MTQESKRRGKSRKHKNQSLSQQQKKTQEKTAQCFIDQPNKSSSKTKSKFNNEQRGLVLKISTLCAYRRVAKTVPNIFLIYALKSLDRVRESSILCIKYVVLNGPF